MIEVYHEYQTIAKYLQSEKIPLFDSQKPRSERFILLKVKFTFQS